MSAAFIFHQECININLNVKERWELHGTVINKNLKWALLSVYTLAYKDNVRCKFNRMSAHLLEKS
jgi:hypothetical protein